MRIIAGKYRGRRLKSPPSLQTRPTSDRLRETLFNILAPLIADTRCLDLCAGSGAVGIEALSRGAANCVFVDRSRKMCDLIRNNLASLEINREQAEVVTHEALGFLQLRVKQNQAPFDIIFFDPPYSSDYEQLLRLTAGNSDKLLAPSGLLVVEHHSKNILAEDYGGLSRYRIVKQGDSSLSFYKA